MLKSYFIMAWRNLLKNKVSSFINIGGLALGLATCILCTLFIVDEFSYDKFHTHLANIYLLMKNQQQDGGVSTGSSTAGPMAAALRNDMPGVKYAAREAAAGGQLIQLGEKKLSQEIVYADPDLFNMMTFPAIAGDPVAALRDPNSVVLTEDAAKRIFGNEDPMGKTFVCNNSHPVKVAAVVRNVPANSSIRFDMVIPFAFFESQNAWLNKWDDNRIHTWFQLEPTANIPVLNAKLTQLLQTRSNDTTVSLFAFPFADRRLKDRFVNGKQSGGRIYMIDMMAVLGLFILLIACINFMNIATARSEYRSREVGVRKVMGASRKTIFFQFLCEALLLTFFALAVGVLLSHVLLPVFNSITDKNIRFHLLDGRIWGLLLGIGLFTGLIAGSYPSLFLSRFQPVRVLKGMTGSGKRNSLLRRVLVTAQFWVAIFFIIGTIVIFSEVSYIKNRPIGYDQENLIDVHAVGPLAGKFGLFKHELSKIPGIKDVSAGSDNLLQFGSGITGMDWPGKLPGHEVSIMVTNVQYDWIRTAGLRLVAGRDFSPSFGTDTAACLINRVTIEKLGLKEPVLGQKLGGKTIIGVVDNFVFNNPSGIIAPMAIYLSTGELNHFFVRIRNDDQWRQTIARIGQAVKKLNPDYPFDLSFTREDYQKRFEEFSSFGLVAAIFGGMAIFISCLGLFGLSSFLAERRNKEMSIRKIFGASVSNVWLLLSMDFLKPVFTAFLLVIPFAIWIMQMLLSNIAYHISLSWWMFAAAGSLAILIALLTTSYEGIRAAFENPIKRLRNE